MKTLNQKLLMEKIHFYPTPWQKEFLLNMKQRNFLAVGRRGGKTLVSTFCALRELLTSNAIVLIIAPSYTLTRRCWDILLTWINRDFNGEGFIINNSNLEIRYGSSLLKCYSAEEPSQILGIGIKRGIIIVDEAARVPRQVYDQYIFPALLDSSEAKLICISTPLGRNSIFFEKYQIGLTGTDPNWASWNFPSSANPYLKASDLELLRSSIPELTYKQEILSEFVDGASSVFKAKDIDAITKSDCLAESEPGIRYIAGVDLSVKNDYNAVSVVNISNHKLVYFERWNNLSWEITKTKIINILSKYNKARAIVDATSLGSALVENLNKEGAFCEPFIFSSKSKKEMLDKAITFVETHSVFIPPIEVLRNEILSIGYDISPTGQVTYTSPTNDDSLLSWCMALYGLPVGKKPEEDKTWLEKDLERKFRDKKRQQNINGDTSI